MPYNNLITGQVIRRLRVQRGLSQEVLSGLAGMACSHLAMIEAGSKQASVDTLWRIAEALDMRLSELIRQVEVLSGIPDAEPDKILNEKAE